MKDVETFNDIEAPTLRAWNRLMASINLNENVSAEAAEKYIRQFDKGAQVQMFAVGAEIRRVGKDVVRKTLEIE